MLTQSLLQHLPDPVCPDASFPTPPTATPSPTCDIAPFLVILFSSSSSWRWPTRHVWSAICHRRPASLMNERVLTLKWRYLLTLPFLWCPCPSMSSTMYTWLRFDSINKNLEMFASFVYLVFFVALISCINKKLECNPSFLGSYFISSYSFLITTRALQEHLKNRSSSAAYSFTYSNLTLWVQNSGLGNRMGKLLHGLSVHCSNLQIDAWAGREYLTRTRV
jgi:hypothetical protein